MRERENNEFRSLGGLDVGARGRGRREGAWTYPARGGDRLVFAPPLIIEASEIEAISNSSSWRWTTSQKILRSEGVPNAHGKAEGFSDGVLAIIITIMVVEFKAPHGADSPPSNPAAHIPELRPELHLHRDLLEQSSPVAPATAQGQRRHPVGQSAPPLLAFPFSVP